LIVASVNVPWGSLGLLFRGYCTQWKCSLALV